MYTSFYSVLWKIFSDFLYAYCSASIHAKRWYASHFIQTDIDIIL